MLTPSIFNNHILTPKKLMIKKELGESIPKLKDTK